MSYIIIKFFKLYRIAFTNIINLNKPKLYNTCSKGKGKAVPLQAWTGPEGSYEVKVPRFRDNGTGWW